MTDRLFSTGLEKELNLRILRIRTLLLTIIRLEEVRNTLVEDLSVTE